MKYAIEDTTLTALAGAIRAKNGSDDEMTPADMETAIGALYGTADWCIREFYGTDTNTLTLSLPWKPSTLCVASQDATGWSTGLTWMNLTLDMKAIGQFCALFQLADGELKSRAATLTPGTLGNYIVYQNGVFTFTPPQSSYWGTSLWRSSVKYTLFAKRGSEE